VIPRDDAMALAGHRARREGHPCPYDPRMASGWRKCDRMIRSGLETEREPRGRTQGARNVDETGAA
jgi:hypothetical protein